MPKLVQAVEFKKDNDRLAKVDVDQLGKIEELKDVYSKVESLVGDSPELKKTIDTKISDKVKEIRTKYWTDRKYIPTKLRTVDGIEVSTKNNSQDLLSLLPKCDLDQLRFLADKFNMIIIPLEYTEIEKLFDTQPKAEQKMLKIAYDDYMKALSEDNEKYDTFILCPLTYYNVWEQVKQERSISLYYPEELDNIFMTIELMIPTQKNLYLATKTNSENMIELKQSFETNIKTLSDKIDNISKKIDKMQSDSISLKNVELKKAETINYSYKDIDPIMFSVKQGTDVSKDNCECTISLCWGSDIEEAIFDLKDIILKHKTFSKIDKTRDISGIYTISDKFNLTKVDLEDFLNRRAVLHCKSKLEFEATLGFLSNSFNYKWYGTGRTCAYAYRTEGCKTIYYWDEHKNNSTLVLKTPNDENTLQYSNVDWYINKQDIRVIEVKYYG